MKQNMVKKVSIRKIYRFIQETSSSSKQSLKIGLLGTRHMIASIKGALQPDPINSVIELSDNAFSKNCDLLVVAIDDIKDLITDLRLKQAPIVYVMANSSKLQNETYLKQLENEIDLKSVILLEEKGFEDKLRALIIEELAEKKLTLGRTLPAFRAQISSQIISNTAWQNTFVAGITFLPGADMPILTLNQIKMVVELAALQNNDLSLDRVKEIATTFGGGYLYRSIARQLLGLLPGPGFIVKAAVSYSGTQATGKLLQKYFERGKS